MGKTLVGILDIAVEIGTTVIGAFAGGPIGAAIGATIGGLVDQGINALLIRSPRPPAMEGTQKQSIPARVSAYGPARSSGYVEFAR